MSLIYIQVNEINYLVSHKSKCNTIKHFIIISFKILSHNCSGVCTRALLNLYALTAAVMRVDDWDAAMSSLPQ